MRQIIITFEEKKDNNVNMVMDSGDPVAATKLENHYVETIKPFLLGALHVASPGVPVGHGFGKTRDEAVAKATIEGDITRSAR